MWPYLCHWLVYFGICCSLFGIRCSVLLHTDKSAAKLQIKSEIAKTTINLLQI